MRYLFPLFVALFIAGCQSSKLMDGMPKSAAEYSIIYVVHGDANYLYHDADGNALQADEHIIAEAKQVAKEAKSGEVFIYHQKPESKILWLFPKKDRRFQYYKNGQKIVEENYSPQSDQNSFFKEAQLYNKYSQFDSAENRKNIFLYFGHEVPEKANYPYHSSRADVPFDTDRFTKGVQSFLPTNTNSPSFHLTVLSTCNNGTPSMIQKLSPFTRYVLASPQNLHLSHIDTEQLPKLLEKKDIDTKSIAEGLAKDTYTRLSQFLQTAITLSVYNTTKTSEYLPETAKKYERYQRTLSSEDVIQDNKDCASLPLFELSELQEGVTTWYQPPKFGSKINNSKKYSGWGCK